MLLSINVIGAEEKDGSLVKEKIHLAPESNGSDVGSSNSSDGKGNTSSGDSSKDSTVNEPKISYWDSFNDNLVNPVCEYVTDNPRPFKILGFSGSAAIIAALVVKFNNGKICGKKITKKKAAFYAGIVAALASTGYYYGPDMFAFLKSYVISSS